MTEVEHCRDSCFNNYIIPFAQESRHSFRRQMVLTKKFLDDGSVEEKKRAKQRFHYLIGNSFTPRA